MDERAYLKVKLKSLAEEAKIIRKETQRAKTGSIKNGLYLHRIHVVRPEARHTHLAYGFLRGKSYEQIERDARVAPNWDKVRKMVSKYGVHQAGYAWGEWKQSQKDKQELLEQFDQWVEKANEQLQKEEAQRSQERKMESQTGT